LKIKQLIKPIYYSKDNFQHETISFQLHNLLINTITKKLNITELLNLQENAVSDIVNYVHYPIFLFCFFNLLCIGNIRYKGLNIF